MENKRHAAKRGKTNNGKTHRGTRNSRHMTARKYTTLNINKVGQSAIDISSQRERRKKYKKKTIK
jgi:hypothetical protein